ncbi:hypothetical protein [Sphingomonas sp.]|uniref:hypothetical protein n=1 Tax=Sphingomonas sp. TaxID=28214 RepID=UPI001B196E6D|nr:hypothetical protein [Sphingomonas sp.]MBO9714801.1 hypothetical protein [Sphingomonas sp.]
MDKRARSRAIGQIAALRAAERVAAQQALGEALAAQQAAEADARRAEVRTNEAVGAWQAQLAEGFAPELARALAADLVARAAETVEARGASARAAEHSDARTSAWRESDARLRQAETLARASRRALRRAREERSLEAQADRITWRWRRA